MNIDKIPPCYLPTSPIVPDFEAEPSKSDYIDVYQKEVDWLSYSGTK